MASLAEVLSGYDIVDLSHPMPESGRPMHDRMPYGYPYQRFEVTREPEDGRGYTMHMILMPEHLNTHMDAPAHFATLAGKQCIHEIPLDRCMGPCCAVDFTDRPSDMLVRAEDFREWEARHGALQEDDIVLVDYSRERHSRLPYPGLSREAAHYLAVEKRIKLFGASTGTVDHSSVCYPTGDPTERRVYGTYTEVAHIELLSHKVIIMENLVHLDRLPPRGAFYLGLPLPIQGGTGSPLRAVAFVPKKS